MSRANGVDDEQQALHVSLEPGPPIERCVTPCKETIPRGRYRLSIRETSESLAGTRSVRLERDGELMISPAARSTRTLGLVLGIAGATMLVGSLAALAASGPGTSCDGATRCGSGALEVLVIGLALPGIVLTPTGWILFAATYRPGANLKPTGPTASVGVLPLAGGGGLSGTLVF